MAMYHCLSDGSGPPTGVDRCQPTPAPAENRNSKSEARKSKFENRNSKLETRNPKIEIRQSKIVNRESLRLLPQRHSFENRNSSIANHKSPIANGRSPIVNRKSSIPSGPLPSCWHACSYFHLSGGLSEPRPARLALPASRWGRNQRGFTACGKTHLACRSEGSAILQGRTTPRRPRALSRRARHPVVPSFSKRDSSLRSLENHPNHVIPAKLVPAKAGSGNPLRQKRGPPVARG